jgi:hypothetical protein
MIVTEFREYKGFLNLAKWKGFVADVNEVLKGVYAHLNLLFD